MRNLLIIIVFSFSSLSLFAQGTPPAADPSEVVEYRVKKGETLGAVAKAHGLSWKAFVKINQHIEDFNKAEVGMVVYVPAPKAAIESKPETDVAKDKATSTEPQKEAAEEDKIVDEAAEAPATEAEAQSEPEAADAPAEVAAEPEPEVAIEAAAPISDNEMEGKADAVEDAAPEEESAPAAQPEEAAEESSDEVATPASVDAQVQESTAEEPLNYSANGYVRLGYSTFTSRRFFGIRMPANDDAAKNPHVGRNDGFNLSDARLNFRAQYKDLVQGRLSFDGAMVEYADEDSPVGHLSTGFKDAYVSFPMGEKMLLIAGRFKPPFDVEELTATRDQWFVHRALESRGVKRHEGFSGDMGGMAPGRQLGMMLTADRPGLWGKFGLGYALALTNGNGGEESLNDNDLPALWMRTFLSWNRDAAKARDGEEGPASTSTKGGTIGLSAYVNEVTVGTAPNRFHDRVYGAGFDTSANYSRFFFRAQVLTQITQHLLSGGGTPQEISLGGHGQFGFRLPGVALYPVYRFAYYNPRFAVQDDEVVDEGDFAQVIHQTLGLRYMPEDKPWNFIAEYTHSAEQSGRSIANDRVEAAFQVDF
ncbi:MAG: porin [Myxococcota bacterium]|nr:porin [Myxococcota bacterium]